MEMLIGDVIEGLTSIEGDNTVPKNVRVRVKTAIDILTSNNETSMDLKIDKSLEELSNVADDPNLPQHTRMQIWSVVSQLENR